MKIVKCLLSVVLAVVAMACFAQQREPMFIQVSDPQLGFNSGGDDFSHEQELMVRITEQINRMKPDFVVFSGDLVHNADNEAALEAFGKICEAFDKDIPLYYVPGNHDVGNDASAEAVEAFVERYGHDRFVHKAKHYTLIGFNSCVIKAATAAEPAEYAWLERELKRARRNKPIIVVSHHPLFLSSVDEAESYENIPHPLRQRYLSLFELYGVDLVLTGHLHQTASSHYGSIAFVTAGPASVPFGQTKSGFQIVTISNGKPQAEYVAIDDIE